MATCPGGPAAAATAAAASAVRSSVEADERTHPDTARAMPSMSEFSGASYCLW